MPYDGEKAALVPAGLGTDHPADLEVHRLHLSLLYGRVIMTGPSGVIATVCSKCAERLPSAVSTVQPSG